MALGSDGRLGGTRIVPTIRTRIVLSGPVSYYPDPYRTIRPRIVLSGRVSYYPDSYRTIQHRTLPACILCEYSCNTLCNPPEAADWGLPSYTAVAGQRVESPGVGPQRRGSG